MAEVRDVREAGWGRLDGIGWDISMVERSSLGLIGGCVVGVWRACALREDSGGDSRGSSVGSHGGSYSGIGAGVCSVGIVSPTGSGSSSLGSHPSSIYSVGLVLLDRSGAFSFPGSEFHPGWMGCSAAFIFLEDPGPSPDREVLIVGLGWTGYSTVGVLFPISDAARSDPPSPRLPLVVLTALSLDVPPAATDPIPIQSYPPTGLPGNASSVPPRAMAVLTSSTLWWSTYSPDRRWNCPSSATTYSNPTATVTDTNCVRLRTSTTPPSPDSIAVTDSLSTTRTSFRKRVSWVTRVLRHSSGTKIGVSLSSSRPLEIGVPS